MDYDILEEKWVEIVNKCFDQGYNSLSSDERIWFNVRCLIDAVNDGGIISFYYNTGADYMAETIEDLNTIKAKNIVTMLNKVNALFPSGIPPKSIDERNDVINSWDESSKSEKIYTLLEKLDSKFYEQSDALEAKIEVYIKRLINI